MDVRSILLLALLLPAACNAKQPPSASLSLPQIAAEVDNGHGDAMEASLLDLHKKNPRDAEVMTQLARIEYLRAVAGRAQTPGMPPMNWDKGHMEGAERWAAKATEADPRHANAWVVFGQIRYAQFQLDESLSLLERAESLDPSSIKLRLRKGATLRSLAEYRGDTSLLNPATREYQLAIKGRIDDGNERLAASELAEIYGVSGQSNKAADYLAQALESAEGRERAFLLDRRAKVHLDAGNVDAALTDSRTSLELLNFGVGRTTLAQGLLVKAGVLMRDAKPDEANRYVSEALESGVPPESLLPTLAARPSTFPAVYAVLVPDLKERGGIRAVAQAVGESAWFVSGADLQRLHALGIDFNVVDPYSGTILHRAIAANNVEAVNALLDLGVDTSIAHPNGRSLLDTTLIGTSPERKEIRRLVLVKTGRPSGWKEPDVELPQKGRWYKVTNAIGNGNGQHEVLQVGQTVLSGGECTFQDKPDQCLVFYRAPGEYLATVAVPISRLGDLKALQEVPAPNDLGTNAQN